MYQKILNEAIEELKQEKFNELFTDSQKKYFTRDCQIDTDLEILIPETYISNVEERLNVYKELTNITLEEQLQIFKSNLEDRFGKIPKSVEDLISSMKLKWIAKKLGFERLLLKNGEMRAYFTTKKDSLYFESESFSKILEFLKQNFTMSEMKEKSDKLVLIIKNIRSANKAIEICNNISNIKLRN